MLTESPALHVMLGLHQFNKINKENDHYKASLSPWGTKKPLLTNCSLRVHTLYIITRFSREAEYL